jgi:hypothetical protein
MEEISEFKSETGRLAWSIARLAAASDLSESTIRRAIRDGALCARRFGARIVIPDADARAFLRGSADGLSDHHRLKLD